MQNLVKRLVSKGWKLTQIAIIKISILVYGLFLFGTL